MTSRYQRQVFGSLLPILHRTASILEGAHNAAAVGGAKDEYLGLDKNAAKLIDCCKTPYMTFDESAVEFHVQEYRCRSRNCPRCAITRAETIRASIKPIFEKMNSPRFLTLTLKSADTPLREQLQRLIHCFAKLRRAREWKTHFEGGIYTIEVTYNRQTQQWHPHLHAIVDGRNFPVKRLSGLWRQATGDSYIVDLRFCYDRRQCAHYITKYITKTNDATRFPDHMIADWCIGIHGLRFVSTFGTCRGEKIIDDEETIERDFTHVGYLSVIDRAAANGNQEAEQLYEDLLHHARKGALPEDPAQREKTVQIRIDLFDQARNFIDLAMLPGPDPPDPESAAPLLRNPQPNTTKLLFDIAASIFD